MLQRLDERISWTEGRIGEHSMLLDNVTNTCARLEARMDRLESRMDRLEDRMDRRFEAVDLRFDTLERKVDHGFIWLVGIQITTFVAISAAVLSR